MGLHSKAKFLDLGVELYLFLRQSKLQCLCMAVFQATLMFVMQTRTCQRYHLMGLHTKAKFLDLGIELYLLLRQNKLECLRLAVFQASLMFVMQTRTYKRYHQMGLHFKTSSKIKLFTLRQSKLECLCLPVFRPSLVFVVWAGACLSEAPYSTPGWALSLTIK